jgi:pyruvate/2-oxoglutarate dehydrogenase complex dihydrolipoamide dehydrogenase (E3) component
VYEQTNIPHIYAIGDVVQGKHQLTPLAIQAGKLLAKRLMTDSQLHTDYVNVPTTVFTPLEFGSIGLAEDDAELIYGADNIEVGEGVERWEVVGGDVMVEGSGGGGGDGEGGDGKWGAGDGKGRQEMGGGEVERREERR